jgi:hypothetical protein
MNLRALALGTLTVAILDIAEVLVFYAVRGVSPLRILQAVAAGALGRAAFTGGMQSAVIGLLLHTFIAFVVVLVYHLAATRFPVLTRRAILCGALYGLLVYAFMNFVVLPLSASGSPNLTSWLIVANGLFAHVFCVGIPAAISTRWAGRPSTVFALSLTR